MSKSLALLQWVRFGRRRGSQPTVAMPSVAEAEPAEFAETAATLALQIERFFWGGERGGGPPKLDLVSHQSAGHPRVCPPPRPQEGQGCHEGNERSSLPVRFRHGPVAARASSVSCQRRGRGCDQLRLDVP